VRWSLAAVLASCWIAPVPPEPATAPSRVVVATRAPRTMETAWLGHYTCTQGDTSVNLRVAWGADGGASAVFEFGPLPENPTVPAGSYTLRGVVRDDPSGAFEVELVPDRWIERPDGYVMVGVHAVSDVARTRLVGRIDMAGCGALEVSRTD
jgi:hypothetical protein